MGRASRAMGACLGVAMVVACSGDGPTPPQVEGCENGIGQIANLQPGQVYLGLTPETSRCVELVEASGRYVVAVLNSSTSPTPEVSFQLRGNGGGAVAGVGAIPSPSINTADAAAVLGHRHALGLELEHRVAHQDMLRRNLRFLRTLPELRGTRRAPGVAESPHFALSQHVNPEVGAISALRIADLDDQEAELCSELNFIDIEARTVYSGPVAIIVEDVNAPLATQMDAMYVQMGQEFEQNMMPILTENFGNPLRLNPTGRLVMVFSPAVNDFQRNVAGFVISCDFAPRTAVPSSNEGEFFYAMVPTSAANNFDGLTRLNWRRLMRSTLIHEVKHITSFAERISRNATAFEETWLEEATAMIAEEIWARGVYGVPWRGNVTYEQSVYCDVRPTFQECADAPLVMFSHFFLLSRYLERPEELSPLGDPPGEEGATFYGSGWSFVRWAIDQYASSESAFLLPLTQGTQTGLTNIQARTGRQWPEMLAHWSLANAVDDRNFTTQVQQITHPSWDYRNMFGRLRRDLPNVFSRQYPLTPRLVNFGGFTEIVGGIVGGTASFFELHGPAVQRQVIELRSMEGGTPSNLLRLAVVRVQ